MRKSEFTNSFKVKADAERELVRRQEESKIIYKGDSVYEVSGGYFVGTYYEYKLLIGI